MLGCVFCGSIFQGKKWIEEFGEEPFSSALLEPFFCNKGCVALAVLIVLIENVEQKNQRADLAEGV